MSYQATNSNLRLSKHDLIISLAHLTLNFCRLYLIYAKFSIIHQFCLFLTMFPQNFLLQFVKLTNLLRFLQSEPSFFESKFSSTPFTIFRSWLHLPKLLALFRQVLNAIFLVLVVNLFIFILLPPSALICAIL